MNKDQLHAERRAALAPMILRYYPSLGIGHKAVAEKLSLSPRLVRTILIEQGVYRPGALNTREKRSARTKAQRAPSAWRLEEKRRDALAKAKRTRAVRDLPLFKPIRPKYVARSSMPLPSLLRERAKDMEIYNSCPQFKLRNLLRKRINKVVRGVDKSASTIRLLGCSIEEFMAHIEGLWQPGMSWANHTSGTRGWHIDHIRPCASFDLTNSEQQRECFHYSNLRPLWGVENISKGSLYEGKRHRAVRNLGSFTSA